MLRRTALLLILAVTPGCSGAPDEDGEPDGGTDPQIISFGPDRLEIVRGENVTLSWQTVDSVELALTYQNGQPVDLSGLDVGSDGAVVTPLETTRFLLTATGSAGTEPAYAETTVTVTHVDPPLNPMIISFGATPNPIIEGESAVLSWVTSDARSLSLVDQNGQPIDVFGAGVDGGWVGVSPTTTTEYVLTASSQAGTLPATARVTVTVEPVVVTGPTIVSFSAEPASIQAGESTTIAWVTLDAFSLALSDQAGQAIDIGMASIAADSVTVAPAESTQYTLTAAGAAGSTPAVAITAVTVLVDPASGLCWRSLQNMCAKAHACTVDKTNDSDNDGTPDFEEFNGTSPVECVAMYDQGFTALLGSATIEINAADCDAVTSDNTCPVATPTYDPVATEQCISNYEAQTCAEFNDPGTPAPTACADVCTP